MTERLCSFPDCGRKYASRGLCDSHRKQQLAGKELTPIGARRTVCSVEGCDGKHYARGYCRYHYNRKMTCDIPNCPDTHYARGLCKRHYQKMQRDSPAKRLCEHEGCEGKHYGRGLCAKHYKRLQRSEMPIPEPKPRKAKSKLPPGWNKPARKSDEQTPSVAGGVPPILDIRDSTYEEVRAVVYLANTRDAHDLLEMLLPDNWRQVVEAERAEHGR
mgnify:CR=1 FL=1